MIQEESEAPSHIQDKLNSSSPCLLPTTARLLRRALPLSGVRLRVFCPRVFATLGLLVLARGRLRSLGLRQHILNTLNRLLQNALLAEADDDGAPLPGREGWGGGEELGVGLRGRQHHHLRLTVLFHPEYGGKKKHTPRDPLHPHTPPPSSPAHPSRYATRPPRPRQTRASASPWAASPSQ